LQGASTNRKVWILAHFHLWGKEDEEKARGDEALIVSERLLQPPPSPKTRKKPQKKVKKKREAPENAGAAAGRLFLTFSPIFKEIFKFSGGGDDKECGART